MSSGLRGRIRRFGLFAALAATLSAPVVAAPAAWSTSGAGCVFTEAAPTPPSPTGTPHVTGYVPNGVSLEWSPSTPVSCPIAKYQVYGTANGTETLVATSTAPFVTVSGLASATYTFQVEAVDTSFNVSPLSPGVSVAISAFPPAIDPPCVVTYTPQNWSGGFTLTVTLRNEGLVSPPINGWKLTFPMGGDQQVTSAWNATVTQSGPQVTATNLAYNAQIPYNGSVTFGMQGTWSTSDAAPGPAVLSPQPFGGTWQC